MKGQLHVPAALPQVKKRPVSME